MRVLELSPARVGNDLEMGKLKATSRSRPVLAVAKPAGRRKGRFRLPALVVLCFLGFFLFFVFLGSRPRNSSGSNGNTRTQQQQQRGRQGGQGGGKGVATAGVGGLPRLYGYKVVREFMHDPGAFTQGLQFDRQCGKKGGAAKREDCREVLWESTGLNGRSSVREVELATGKVLRSKALPRQDFGEGVARLGDRLYQLTWQTPRLWSYSVDNFEDAQLHQTPLEDGWGITADPGAGQLVVGDSSERLTFLDPGTMRAARTVTVSDGGRAVPWLNELEWVDGLIYANIWQRQCIAQIDPQSGAVVGWVNLEGLRDVMLAAAAQDKGGGGRSADVLNGIAWDAEQRRLFVTGKLWSRLYQIELVPLDSSGSGQGGNGTGSSGQPSEAAVQRMRDKCIVSNPAMLG